MKKIVFIDIDDTIRNEKGIITNRVKNAINMLNGTDVLVILTTGRDRFHTIKVAKEVNSSNYIVCSGGSDVYDYVNDIDIYNTSLNKESIISLYDLSMENDTILYYCFNEGKFSTKETGLKDVFIKPFEYIVNKNIFQCIINTPDFKKGVLLKKYIDDIPNIVITNLSKSLINPNVSPGRVTYYDISSIGTSKGIAIKELCKYLNIDIYNTIGIGDNENDISMFDVVGLSVAVENANDFTKSKVDRIIKSIDEDGVAIFLEELYKSMI